MTIGVSECDDSRDTVRSFRKPGNKFLINTNLYQWSMRTKSRRRITIGEVLLKFCRILSFVLNNC